MAMALIGQSSGFPKTEVEPGPALGTSSNSTSSELIRRQHYFTRFKEKAYPRDSPTPLAATNFLSYYYTFFFLFCLFLLGG